MQSVIASASPDLLREAAQQRGWPRVLATLGLSASFDNILAFRVRARALGIDVGHLRQPTAWTRCQQPSCGTRLPARRPRLMSSLD